MVRDQKHIEFDISVSNLHLQNKCKLLFFHNQKYKCTKFTMLIYFIVKDKTFKNCVNINLRRRGYFRKKHDVYFLVKYRTMLKTF